MKRFSWKHNRLTTERIRTNRYRVNVKVSLLQRIKLWRLKRKRRSIAARLATHSRNSRQQRIPDNGVDWVAKYREIEDEIHQIRARALLKTYPHGNVPAW